MVYQKHHNLCEKFATETQEMQAYLTNLKEESNSFDKDCPTEQNKISFIENKLAVISKVLDDHFDKIWSLFLTLSRKDGLIHQEFYQSQLHPFLKVPPLNERIYSKPLGYAGDFITANYFYEDDYPGGSTYEKLINRYTLSIPVTRAHINRRPYFKKLILKIIEDNKDKKESIRISSFACGAAVEFFDVLKECNDIDNLSFTGIEGEILAIQDMQKRIKSLPPSKQKVNINLMHENILNLIRKNQVPNTILNQTFIYCAGFLDYLSDTTASRLIQYLHNLLSDNGLLVLVNVSSESPHRAYYELLGEWYLHYRNPEQLLNLSERLGAYRKAYIELEPKTRMNLFLVIKK